MKRALLAAAACLLITAAPAAALTDEECATRWKQADVNNDGKVDAAESERFNASLRIANKTVPADGVMTDTIFLENCKADVFTTAKVDDGAPLEGANSFTEEQARDRAVAAGLSNVSALTQDDKGIWRGTAKRQGADVKVAIDYKGNVVVN